MAIGSRTVSVTTTATRLDTVDDTAGGDALYGIVAAATSDVRVLETGV